MNQPVTPGLSRIEGFSDAVFAFAVTLLVVSLEVPSRYAEMIEAMRMLPAFAASFAILLLIWQEHRSFFKRFGVDDGILSWLNGGLLFMVLAYVYPLKFLMRLLVGPQGLLTGQMPPDLEPSDFPALMLMYGLGFALLFGLLAAMHWRALRCHRRAGADAALLRNIKVGMGTSLVYVAVAGTSMLVAGLGRSPVAVGIAGWIYGLTGLAHWLYHALIVPRLLPATRPPDAGTPA